MKESYNIFEQTFTIRSYQVDNETFLTIPSLFSMMQEVAWEHANRHEAGRDFLHPLNLFWALSKVYVKINRLPKWNEKVTFKTWGKEVKFLTHPRDYELYDESGELLLAATSNWIILDTFQFKPQKVEFRYASDYTYNQKDAVSVKVPKLKAIDFQDEMPHFNPVLYSDLDMNQHVNNAKYLQWLLDSHSYKNFSISNIKEIAINYISQAKLGDNYAIKTVSVEPNANLSSLFGKNKGEEYCRIYIGW